MNTWTSSIRLERGLRFRERRLWHSTGSSRMAGIPDHGSADNPGQRARSQRPSRSLQSSFLGLGNESWDCGGNMTPEYYSSQMKIYSRFVRNFNPAQQDKQQMLKIAVGPGGAEPRWTEWTETIMKAYQQHTWSWDINGLSMHSYTVGKWPPAFASENFGETEYSQFLKPRLAMDDLISQHSAIMDKYDPEKKVALVVDEWGVVRAIAGQQSGISGTAEQPARRNPGRAEPEYICSPRRPGTHGQHRANDQRTAGNDPDRQRKDGADADIPRLQDVHAISGLNVCSHRIRRRQVYPRRYHFATRRCHRCERRGR